MSGKSIQAKVNNPLPCTGILLSVLLLLIFSPRGYCDYGPDPPPSLLTPQKIWAGQDNQFVTCTLEDASGWWWGTDNDGVWHYAPRAAAGAKWLHFRAEDGLYDDSITALCLDSKGRVWAGTERRGVSIYNNSGWHNYDFMTGPLGVHVTSIVMNPMNGDIWTSSEGGISIYSESSKTWRYITTANGLPTNDLNCLAFTSTGQAIVGTANDGLLIATNLSHYSSWTHITAVPAAVTTEAGSGLPSNQIDCLLVNKANVIYVGTSSGLSSSSDAGQTWNYRHGWMWQDKIRRYIRNTIPIDESSPNVPLSDDYVSALAYDKTGLLYIGHRQGGLEVIDPVDGSQQFHTRLNGYGVDIRSLTVLTTGGLLIGNYGDGPYVITWKEKSPLPENGLLKAHLPTPFPIAATPISAAEVTKLREAVTNSQTPANPQVSYFLNEDWLTQGNWVGRYGGELAVLCAANDGQDYVLGNPSLFPVAPEIGLGLNGTSNVSYWLEWDQSGDPRVLFDPATKMRREAEWDDQGEQDARLGEGPDIWLTVSVPAGLHRLSLYFMNKDGHTRVTRFRDYIVQVMPSVAGVDFHQTYDNPTVLPATAETRAANFWPGVYENFVVSGPRTYYVKIDRNFSLNTIIQGVFIDSLGAAQSPAAPLWLNGRSLFAIVPSSNKVIASSKLANIESLWAQLDSCYGSSSIGSYQWITRILLIRAAAAGGAPQSLLSDWRIEIGLWTGEDWTHYSTAIARLNVNSLVKSN